jgi:drug/metabolite transporter (DMT)-like permease
MLAVASGTAFGIALALASHDHAPAAPSAGGWIAGLLIGLAALGIEAGFYEVYRGGAKLASTSVVASVAVTTILALVGVTAFGEKLTTARAVGLLVAIGGAYLARR